MMDSSEAPVSRLTRRRLLSGASRVAAAAAASALMPPNVRRLLAEAPQKKRLAERHQACSPADAGKPLLRPLFRHPRRGSADSRIHPL